MEHVRFALPFQTVFYTPHYLAVALGCFAEEGIEPEQLVPPPPNGVARALLAGHADVGLSGPIRALGALDRGEGRLVCVAEVNSRVGFFLLGRPAAHDFAWRDLVGRRVLVFAEAPTPRLCLEYLLERHGIRLASVDLVDDVPAAQAGEAGPPAGPAARRAARRRRPGAGGRRAGAGARPHGLQRVPGDPAAHGRAAVRPRRRAAGALPGAALARPAAPGRDRRAGRAGLSRGGAGGPDRGDPALPGWPDLGRRSRPAPGRLRRAPGGPPPPRLRQAQPPVRRGRRHQPGRGGGARRRGRVKRAGANAEPGASSLGRLFDPRAIALVGVPGDLSRPGA